MTDRPTDRHTDDAGLSLLELIVVLAILALAMLVALPMIRPTSSPLTVRAVAIEIAAGLRAARDAAIARQHETAVSFDLEARTITIVGESPGRPRPLPAGLDVTLTAARQVGRRASSARIAFFADGSSTGGVVRVTDGQRVARVTVNWLTGAVEIEVNGNE